MIMMQGKGVSKGVVKGPLYFFKRQDNTVTKYTVEDISAEKDRLAQAQEKAIQQLEALAERAREDAGDESAILFETHAMFIEDEDYVDCIQSCLDKEQCNAEYAVLTAGEQFAAMFSTMDDAYMQARAADIRDVSRRLLNNLMGIVEGGIDSDVPVILAADDLAPSEDAIYAAFLRLYYNLKHNPEVLSFHTKQMAEVRKRQMLWSPAAVELNREISDILSQSHALALLNRQGLVDPDIFISKSNQLAEQLRKAKQQKEKLRELHLFSRYNMGVSIRELTEFMNHTAVPYDPGKPWNKNMVARILADTRYLGDSGFPVLIDAAVFLDAKEKRKKKAPSVQKIDAQTVLRRKCGCRITPHIEHEVLYLLNCLARNPKRIVTPQTPRGHSQRLDALKSELEELISQLPVDENRAREVLQEIAAEMYADIDPREYETQRMRRAWAL